MATIEQLIGEEQSRNFRTATRLGTYQQNAKKMKELKRKQVLNQIDKAREKSKKMGKSAKIKKVKPAKIENRSTRSIAKYLAGHISEEQVRSLGIIVNNGKVLLSKKLSNKIISYVQEQNPVRKLGIVHRQKGKKGIPIQMKKIEANIVTIERDDSNLIDESDMDFDMVWLDPIEFDGMAKFTQKLDRMSEFDIEKILVEELGKAILRREVAWFIHSTDNAYSLNSKAVPYIPGTLTNSMYKYLVGAKNAIPTALRKKAIWLINRAAQTELESLLDDTGKPIFKDLANDDFEFEVFNYPVEVSDHIDGTDPSVPIIYFGDFSFFHIQDVLENIEVQRLDELFAEENKVGVSVYEISDGKLIFGPFEIPIYKLDINGLS
ncbi:phage major capsid protein [Enterococcus sp. DIV0187]|uniref:phage major capsid protein n=1 Tax=Enterococcus sp. DIV0187 TaxID=2774644 RepID=UPI003F20BCAE